MKKPVHLYSRAILIVLAWLLPVFLAACAGSDGSKGAAGADGADGTNGADGVDGQDFTPPEPIVSGDFSLDILPLFINNNVFFEGSLACNVCHMSNASESLHELNLGSRTGILKGSDYVSDTDRVDLLGRTPGSGAGECSDPSKTSDSGAAGGACAVTWEESDMRGRLRDTRMPPGWSFDLDRGNRDTSEIMAIRGWVMDGGLENETTGIGGKIGYDTQLQNISSVDATGDFVRTGSAVSGLTDVAATDWQLGDETLTIGDLFKTDGVFFVGSQACDDCHSDPAKHFSWHALDMGNYEGILWGVRDDNAKPATDLGGEDLLGRSSTCDLTLHNTSSAGCTPNWDDSGLKARLRNTRMPPGWPFDLTTDNRDMYAIESIGAWVEAGAPAGAF